MKTECTAGQLEFHGLGRRAVVGQFDGGKISSDSGGLLLREVEQRTHNSFCERVIGTLRRECLDYFIPITESHLRSITKNWMTQYNKERPHSSPGPGIPNPPSNLPAALQTHRHRIPDHLKVMAHPTPGGLHHEYGLLPKAA